MAGQPCRLLLHRNLFPKIMSQTFPWDKCALISTVSRAVLSVMGEKNNRIQKPRETLVTDGMEKSLQEDLQKVGLPCPCSSKSEHCLTSHFYLSFSVYKMASKRPCSWGCLYDFQLPTDTQKLLSNC